MDELSLRVSVKRELRKRMRGVRNTLPASVIAQRSEAIRGRILASPLYASAQSVGLFWPIEGRNEVDLRPLVEQARADGKRVAFPATVEDGAEIALRFLDPGLNLDIGPLGFEEPPEQAPLAARVDLLIVPALAIDPAGHRIGYGRGYYDRLLDRMEKPYNSIVVAYDFQLLAEVPTTPGDEPVGWIATDERWFQAGTGFEVSAKPEPPTAPTEPGIKVIPRIAR